MTTEEKLNHFLESSLNEARKKSEGIIQEYQNALDQQYEEHKVFKTKEAETSLRQETAALVRSMNKDLSLERLAIKRTITQKNTELKDALFTEVKNRLEEYMSTAEYDHLMVRQIKEALAFAGDDEVRIYIDPADSTKQMELSVATNANIKVSAYSFGGGTRAVIPAKNILIDNSFDTKLREEKEAFRFDGGGFYE